MCRIEELVVKHLKRPHSKRQYVQYLMLRGFHFFSFSFVESVVSSVVFGLIDCTGIYRTTSEPHMWLTSEITSDVLSTSLIVVLSGTLHFAKASVSTFWIWILQTSCSAKTLPVVLLSKHLQINLNLRSFLYSWPTKCRTHWQSITAPSALDLYQLWWTITPSSDEEKNAFSCV